MFPIKAKKKIVTEKYETEICSSCGGSKYFLIIWEYLLRPENHYRTNCTIRSCFDCNGTGKMDWIKKISLDETDVVSKIFWDEYKKGRIRNVIITPITDYEIEKSKKNEKRTL